MNYEDFLHQKTHSANQYGFWQGILPEFLYPFQADLVRWALQKGRAAIFADCGLGKTPMQLVWADHVARREGKPVLILTPLAVGAQTVGEAEKFGYDARQSRDGTVYAPVTITNYEQLHRFSPEDFGGVVCDESSILKSFRGATQQAVTRFLTKMPYRLLCTATAAPNDYVELGTSAEALGALGYQDMLSRFFVPGASFYRLNAIRQRRSARTDNQAAQTVGQWRMKPHAQEAFWRWVCSWARACRTPADLGYDDDAFLLPPLLEKTHQLVPEQHAEGMLFTMPAYGLQEERAERRRTLAQRCEMAASLVAHDAPAVVWCHLNDEGDLLAKLLPDAVQVKGAMSDDAKIAAYDAFRDGEARVMICKPSIGAWGLNWQHCNHVVTFASHSYEQYYQSVRRCWRFGQTRPVTVDIVLTDGEAYVAENMARKASAAQIMFTQLVMYMHQSQSFERKEHTLTAEIPQWIK